MVSFSGSFRNSRFGRKSLNTSKLRGAGGRVGDSTSRFGGNVNEDRKSCIGEQSDANQKNNIGINKYRQNTPWQKGDVSNFGWKDAFGKAIFGNKERRRLRKEEMKKRVLNKRAGEINRGWRDGKLPEELLGAEIKIDRKIKTGDVKYNYRKNIISISETDGLKKKELPKQIIQLVQSEKFRKTTGVGKMTAEKKQVIKGMLRQKGGTIERANKKMSAVAKHGRQGSSGRKVQLGNLVNKRFK
jgi:hypothetical protein